MNKLSIKNNKLQVILSNIEGIKITDVKDMEFGTRVVTYSWSDDDSDIQDSIDWILHCWNEGYIHTKKYDNKEWRIMSMVHRDRLDDFYRSRFSR